MKRYPMITAMALLLAAASSLHAAPGRGAPEGQIVAQQGGRCVDIAGPENGAPVQLYSCHGGENQRFRYENGLLRSGGLCLDVSGGEGENGAKVIAYECHGKQNQRWRLESNGSVRSEMGGRCLDASGGHDGDGTRLIVYDCHGKANQRFSFQSQRPGNDRGPGRGDRDGRGQQIQSGQNSNLCVDVGRDGKARLGTCSRGDDGQRFSYDRGQIRSGDLCLDASGGGDRNGAEVIAYACHGRANQRWRIEGSQIRNEEGGRCLDADGEARMGAKLQVWDCHGRGNQRFNFR